MSELITQRLILRPPRISDFDAFFALTQSSDVHRFLGGKAPSRADSFERVLRGVGSWTLYGYGNFTVVERATDAFVGNCGIFHFYRGLGDDVDDQSEAGWIIAQDHWKKGYATEAMIAVLAWFDRVHLGRTSFCMIEPGNIPSERLAAHLGFAPTRATEYKGDPVQLYHRG